MIISFCRSRTLWFYWVSRIDPRLKAAENGGYILKSVFNEDGRRTGARLFAGSGAVGDDPLIGVKFTKAFFEFAKWDIDCACNVIALIGFR